MNRTLRVIVLRDLLLAVRRRADVATTLFFFVIVASLFPLGVGPDTQFFVDPRSQLSIDSLENPVSRGVARPLRPVKFGFVLGMGNANHQS